MAELLVKHLCIGLFDNVQACIFKDLLQADPRPDLLSLAYEFLTDTIHYLVLDNDECLSMLGPDLILLRCSQTCLHSAQEFCCPFISQVPDAISHHHTVVVLLWFKILHTDVIEGTCQIEIALELSSL